MALSETYRNREAVGRKLEMFGQALYRRAEKYGEPYKNILTASLRQAVGAHKLVKDGKGGSVVSLQGMRLQRLHCDGGYQLSLRTPFSVV